MKAVVLTRYGKPADLRIEEVSDPVPADHEVLVRVYAASINDWDWNMVRGSPFYMRVICGLIRPKIRIPGVDIAGVVEAAGKDVTRFQPGDEVYGDLSDCGFGGFAEYVCAPATALAPMPEDMAFTDAAAIPHAAMLAVQGLRDKGQMQPGSKLLINGAGGGVGTIGVQIAKCLGVSDVTGVDTVEKSAAMLASGFSRTIDYRHEDFTRSGDQYDLILDSKTNRSVFAYARALKPGGTYVTVGGTLGKLILVLLVGPIMRALTGKKISVLGLKPNRGMDYFNGLWETGAIEPMLDGPYSLEEVPEAIAYFGSGRHKGKVIVNIAG